MSRPSSAGGAAGGLGAVKVGGSKHGGSGGTTASAAAAAVGVPGSVSVTAAAVALPITALPGQSAELTALFECPVCFDYVLPPILQCQAGHLVCNQCRQKLSCCPTCRGPLTPSIRNLAMEKVASTLPFPCKVEAFLACKKMQHQIFTDANIIGDSWRDIIMYQQKYIFSNGVAYCLKCKDVIEKQCHDIHNVRPSYF